MEEKLLYNGHYWSPNQTCTIDSKCVYMLMASYILYNNYSLPYDKVRIV